MATSIELEVERIANALESLSGIMMQPDSLQLMSTHRAIERLHAALPLLGNINAAFAYLCQRDKAGNLVGANHPVEYLTQRLGLSRGAAFDLLDHGSALFGEPHIPPVPPQKNTANTSPDGLSALTAEERMRHEQEAERRKAAAKAAQELARKAAQEKRATEEKKRIIRQVLRDLNEHSDPGRAELYAHALEAAGQMNPEELRKYVTSRVRKANRAGRDLGGKIDPLAAYKKRTIVFSEPDADGGSWAKIYLDRASRALLEAALAGGDAPGSHLPEGHEDTRHKRQRRFDHLMEIIRRYSTAKTTRQGGVGTLVVTFTLEDLRTAGPETEFSCNTGAGLTALDLVQLGLAGDSFALQLDSATAVPLSMGRARFASIEQRILLLAMQGVCAWNGCTKSGIELEAHHLVPYLRGGVTSIDNLLLLCREHHSCNNDHRDGSGGKGYFDKDPRTGMVYHHPAGGGPPTATATYQYRQSPGQRLAERAQRRHGRASPDRGTSAAPVRTRDPVLFQPG